MPIKHLTVNREAQFPEIGTLRKGGPKTDPKRPGPDLTHFRFVSEDQAAMRDFTAEYGTQATSIRILMPFPTVEQNFSAWMEDWVASSLKHRCDGETCVLWLEKGGKYSTERIPCPGGCKQVGRLKVVIPALQRLAYVTVTTTSKWDIINLHENLTALERLRGNLTGIPLVLNRKPREISTPGTDGKRARRKKSLLTIEAEPTWVRLQLAAQQQAALPVLREPLMLVSAPAALAEPDEEEELDLTGATFIDEALIDDEGEDEPQTVEEAGRELYEAGAVKKEGAVYMIGANTVSKVGKILQCSCIPKRESVNDASCAHIEAMRLYALASQQAA